MFQRLQRTATEKSPAKSARSALCRWDPWGSFISFDCGPAEPRLTGTRSVPELTDPAGGHLFIILGTTLSLLRGRANFFVVTLSYYRGCNKKVFFLQPCHGYDYDYDHDYDYDENVYWGFSPLEYDYLYEFYNCKCVCRYG